MWTAGDGGVFACLWDVFASISVLICVFRTLFCGWLLLCASTLFYLIFVTHAHAVPPIKLDMMSSKSVLSFKNKFTWSHTEKTDLNSWRLFSDSDRGSFFRFQTSRYPPSAAGMLIFQISVAASQIFVAPSQISALPAQIWPKAEENTVDASAAPLSLQLTLSAAVFFQISSLSLCCSVTNMLLVLFVVVSQI